MGLIGMLVIGLIVGALAKFIMPGKDPGGILITMALGIGGAFLGTWLGRLVGLYSAGETTGFIGATVGAIIILWIYRKTRKAPAA